MGQAVHPDGRAAGSCSGVSNIYADNDIIGNACVAGAGLYIDADTDIISNSDADDGAISNSYSDADAISNSHADADAINNSYADANANARANRLCDDL